MTKKDTIKKPLDKEIEEGTIRKHPDDDALHQRYHKGRWVDIHVVALNKQEAREGRFGPLKEVFLFLKAEGRDSGIKKFAYMGVEVEFEQSATDHGELPDSEAPKTSPLQTTAEDLMSWGSKEEFRNPL